MRSARSFQILGPLLRATAQGDQEAFSNLYRLTSTKLFRICASILPDEAEARDALQDVYLQVWLNACKYDEAKASPITWLATLARNRALDRLRIRRPMPRSDAEFWDVPCEAPPILEALITSQEQEQLALCLKELDAQSETLIRGAFFKGATHCELAQQQSLPLGTVKGKVRRGLLRLRALLQG